MRLPDIDDAAQQDQQAGPPETGDIVIDAALRDLANTPEGDLDGQLEAGEAVHRTLQGRLTDLGG
ncbi:hypothetical protein GCM10023153_04880 [Ornithinibacter aureus]|uniref:Uncharacterized protein n=1 Tax=Ornithinibacter aureus TaxID=622664 RepID=A0ABP8JD77_9MICO|nr:hypothetical protein [Ornithinibacter aureus]KAF0832554.1 hypothetical protein C8E84_0305 [Ornithinibacter aureus]